MEEDFNHPSPHPAPSPLYTHPAFRDSGLGGQGLGDRRGQDAHRGRGQQEATGCGTFPRG